MLVPSFVQTRPNSPVLAFRALLMITLLSYCEATTECTSGSFLRVGAEDITSLTLSGDVLILDNGGIWTRRPGMGGDSQAGVCTLCPASKYSTEPVTTNNSIN